MLKFIRKEIARGRSGRLIVRELVRLGHCDEDKARELVAREGPAVYAGLRFRSLLFAVMGAFLLLQVFLVPLLLPPNIHSNNAVAYIVLFAVAIIAGPILLAFGWAGHHKYRKWNENLETVDTLSARLEGFARESMKEGRGEWWIVNEMVRRSEIDETQAREIVARVTPGLFVQFIRRRRRFFTVGASVLALSLLGLFSDIPHATTYSIVGLVVGSFILAHGLPGLRRLRNGDAPTSLPGSGETAPVRTGLGWRAEPFE